MDVILSGHRHTLTARLLPSFLSVPHKKLLEPRTRSVRGVVSEKEASAGR